MRISTRELARLATSNIKNLFTQYRELRARVSHLEALVEELQAEQSKSVARHDSYNEVLDILVADLVKRVGGTTNSCPCPSYTNDRAKDSEYSKRVKSARQALQASKGGRS